LSISKKEPEIKFGTDGWRGVISDEFTFENLGKVAVKIADHLGKGKRVSVGYDNRFLSDRYADFLSAVLQERGHEIDLSDRPVTTPCVSHRVKTTESDLGVAISASHNPAAYNGLKVKQPYGGSASGEFISEMISNITKTEYEGPTWQLRYKGDKNSWVEGYMELFYDIIPENDIKVVCDYFYSPGFPLFDRVLRKKGYDTLSLKTERDPLFGGTHPEPVPAHLGDLKDAVISSGADAGFAFDGDADRIAFIDEFGRYLSLQVLLAVLAWDILESGRRGKIVKTVAGTYLVDRIARHFSVDFKTVPIGFKNICPEMLCGDVIVAGEESGGIGFSDYLPERDALYSASRLLEIIKRRGEGIGHIWNRLREKFGNSVYLRRDFRIEKGVAKKEILRRVKKNCRGAEFPFKVEGFLEIDGIRINMEEGRWLLVRPSGTEPLVRVYAETESREKTQELIKKGGELFN